jgi:hypothetical protein
MGQKKELNFQGLLFTAKPGKAWHVWGVASDPGWQEYEEVYLRELGRL